MSHRLPDVKTVIFRQPLEITQPLFKRVFHKGIQAAVPAMVVMAAARHFVKYMIDAKSVACLHEIAHTVIHHMIVFPRDEEQEF